MRSLTAYCENTNGANISQGNVTREKSRNMMLACGWITAVENRQSKAEVGVRSREKDEVSEKVRPRHQLICGKKRKAKSQIQYGLPHEHSSVERRGCPMRLVI